jgi:hypothetical protein
MMQSDPEIRARAAALAEEIAAGVRRGRPLEWLEEVLGTALLDVARSERERCAAVADHRARVWEASARRMSSGGWPAEGLVEARERRKEALVLADALRADLPAPHDA